MRIWVEPMLGRLARWLRLMGYDAPLRQGDWPRPLPGEVVLTRRGKAASLAGYLFIEHDSLEGQLRQVVEALGLELRPRALFTRCLSCNQPVAPVNAQEVEGLVPEYVLHTAGSFTRCPSCGKIYWPGSHGQRALERLRAMLGGRV